MIATFYSYKEDMGCTMAAINVGILLSQRWQKKTLIVDWNLIAPRADFYLKGLCKSPSIDLISLLFEYSQLIDDNAPITMDRLTRCGDRSNATSLEDLYYLPASIEGSVPNSFDWEGFYQEYHGGLLLEHLRSLWKGTYDVVIVISEHGVSGAASVCTIQLPDAITIMMELNMGSMQASLEVIEKIHSPGTKADGRGVVILPVSSKVHHVELERQMEAYEAMVEKFSKYLPEELDSDERNRYFSETQIPYMPYYSYVHKIAVMEEPRPHRLSVVNSYTSLVHYLTKLVKLPDTV